MATLPTTSTQISLSGEHVSASGGATFDTFDPSTNEVLASVSTAALEPHLEMKNVYVELGG